MKYGTFHNPPMTTPRKPFDTIVRPDENLQELTCPITSAKIQDLVAEGKACVIFIDGGIYHKDSLLSWLKNHAIAPMTNQPLDVFQIKYALAPLAPNQAELLLAQQKRYQRNLLRFKRGTSLTFCLGSLVGIALLNTKYGIADETKATVTAVILFVIILASAIIFAFLYCSPRAARRIEQHNSLSLSTEELDAIYQQYASLMIPFDACYYVTLTAENAKEPDPEATDVGGLRPAV